MMTVLNAIGTGRNIAHPRSRGTMTKIVGQSTEEDIIINLNMFLFRISEKTELRHMIGQRAEYAVMFQTRNRYVMSQSISKHITTTNKVISRSNQEG